MFTHHKTVQAEGECVSKKADCSFAVRMQGTAVRRNRVDLQPTWPEQVTGIDRISNEKKKPESMSNNGGIDDGRASEQVIDRAQDKGPLEGEIPGTVEEGQAVGNERTRDVISPPDNRVWTREINSPAQYRDVFLKTLLGLMFPLAVSFGNLEEWYVLHL